MSFFETLQSQPQDEFNIIQNKLSNDINPCKIDISSGVYRDIDGKCFILPCVAKAKDSLYQNDPKGHDYNVILGIPEFLLPAARIAVGETPVREGRVASCQTIGGTGACHLGAAFLTEAGYNSFYVGTPAWPNYFPLLKHAGGNVTTFNYYDPVKKNVNFNCFTDTLASAPSGSVFILQLCCHNPTGCDLSLEQWKTVGKIMKERNLIPFFDSAYQGFASGSAEKDGEPIRYFIEEGLEVLVAQSFSKNLGLYGERIGCLHVVTKDCYIKSVTEGHLSCIFRAECTTSPAFPAKIVSLIADDESLSSEWNKELQDIAKRLQLTRKKIFDKLTKEYGLPGSWDHILTQKGMFWFGGLTTEQAAVLIDNYHIYLLKSGRVSIAGINDSNIDYFLKSFYEVVGKN